MPSLTSGRRCAGEEDSSPFFLGTVLAFCAEVSCIGCALEGTDCHWLHLWAGASAVPEASTPHTAHRNVQKQRKQPSFIQCRTRAHWFR